MELLEVALPLLLVASTSGIRQQADAQPDDPDADHQAANKLAVKASRRSSEVLYKPQERDDPDDRRPCPLRLLRPLLGQHWRPVHQLRQVLRPELHH